MEQEHQSADIERVEEETPADFPRIADKLIDLKQIGRFNYQLRNCTTLEEKLADLQVLSNTPSSIIYKFLSSPGLRTIGEWVYEGSQDIPGNAQILGKVFSILKEVQMRIEYLDSAQYLGLGIEKLLLALPSVEENETRELISNVFSKYYHLNKVVINEWSEQFKRKLADPTFKKQALSSEQSKKRPHFTKDYNSNGNKSTYNSSNSSSVYSRDAKSNTFKPNGGISGSSNSTSSRFNRAESPPTSKKFKFNNPPQFYSSQTPSFPKDVRKKNVQFSGDNQVKRFRKEDKPIVSDLTDLEVDQYQEECRKKRESSGQLFVNAQDMRSRENKLEKDNLFQLKETEKKERQQLDAMKEDVPWRTPPKLQELGSKYLSQVSVDSIEKEIHKKRILCKMQCLYGGDNEIPDMPSYENVINDKPSTTEPQKIYLNKLNPEDFIQVIDMAIKNQGKQQQKKAIAERKPLKSILKRPKEEKDRLRKKMLEEKRKTMDEEERMKKNINPIVVQKLLDLIKQNKTNSKDELISTVKSLGLSEKELHNIYQNFNLITQVLQRRGEDVTDLPPGNATAIKDSLKQPQQIVPPVMTTAAVDILSSSSTTMPILPPPPLSAPLPPQRSIPVNNNYPNSAQQYNNTYRVQQIPMNNNNNNNTNINNPNGFNPYPGQQQLPQQQQQQQLPSPYNSNKNMNLNTNKLNNKILPPPSNSSFPQRFPLAGSINNNTNNSSFQSAYPQPGQPYSNQTPQAPQQYGSFQQAPPAGVATPNSAATNFPGGTNNNNNASFNNNRMKQRGNGQNGNFGYQQSQGQQFNRNNNNSGQAIGNFNATKPFQPNNITTPANSQSNYSQGQQQKLQQSTFTSTSNPGSINNTNNNPLPLPSQPQSSPAISIINQYQPNSNSLPQVSLKSTTPSNQQYQSGQTTQQTNPTSNNPQQQQPKPAGNNNNNNNNNNPNNMSGFSMLPPGDERERNIPCRMYHSEMGCHRDTCFFQHIPQYQGRPAPNMHKLVRPMHALSKNTERNLENTFAYNKAKFEKKSNQLGALPFPVQGQQVQQSAPSGTTGTGVFVYPSSNTIPNNSNQYVKNNNNSTNNNNNNDLSISNSSSYPVNNNNSSSSSNNISNSSVSQLSGFPFGQQNPLLKQQQQMQQNQYKQQNPSQLM